MHTSQVSSNDQTRSQSLVSPSTLRRKGADIHLLGCHSEVYEPCHDSFALVDSLLKLNLEEVQQRLCL